MCPGLSPRPYGAAARISKIGTVNWAVPLPCGRTWGQIEFVQLATMYRTSPRQVRYPDLEKEIQRVARVPPTNERYINLFPFEDYTDLARCLGASKYLM